MMVVCFCEFAGNSCSVRLEHCAGSCADGVRASSLSVWCWDGYLLAVDCACLVLSHCYCTWGSDCCHERWLPPSREISS